MKKFICSFMAAVIAVTALATVPASAAESGNSAVTTSAETKLPSPSNYKKSSTATTVTISWDKVDGAAAYKVFMYDDVLKEYTAYKTVKNPTITVKGLTKSTKYQFKVQTLIKVDGKYVAQKRSGSISVTTKEKDLPTAPSKNYTGWGKGDDAKYYFKNGKLCSGFEKIGQSYYYFTKNGYLTGWLNNKEIYYYFGKTGKMVKGKTLTISGNKYEFQADGAVKWYSSTVEPKANYTVSAAKPNLDIFISSRTDSDAGIVGMKITNNGTKNLIIDDLGELIDSQYSSFDRLLALYEGNSEEPFPKKMVIKPGEAKYVFYATLPDNSWYDKKSTIKWYAKYDGVSYLYYTSYYYGTDSYPLHFEIDV